MKLSSHCSSNATNTCLFFERLSGYLQAKQRASQYLHAIPGRGVKFHGFFSHENSGSTFERRGRVRRRWRRDTGHGAKVLLGNLVTFRCHWGVFHGMWSRQPSALSPPSTALRGRQGSFFPPCRSDVSPSPFVHFYTPLPIRTRFVQ